MLNVDSDIIVIGADGCGLMAAKKGLRVLLLEKTDKPGGGTAFSSKGIRAAIACLFAKGEGVMLRILQPPRDKGSSA